MDLCDWDFSKNCTSGQLALNGMSVEGMMGD